MDQPFRWFFVGVSLGALLLSGWHRRRARRSGPIARSREGRGFLLGRLAGAVLIYSGVVAYMIEPRWIGWAALPVPSWLRWIGVVGGLSTLAMLGWVLRSLGPNISETFLTKDNHRLVTHGPYRWVRHPLYAAALASLFCLGLMSANAWIMVSGLLAMAGIAGIVVPREEAHLEARFGELYRAYRRRTGMFFPRIAPRDSDRE